MTDEEMFQRFLAWREIEVPCKRCGGRGSIVYPDTSVWRRGGLAGQAMTGAVCDHCWGSGDEYHKWTDLRRIEGLLNTAGIERKRLEDKLKWTEEQDQAAFDDQKKEIARLEAKVAELTEATKCCGTCVFSHTDYRYELYCNKVGCETFADRLCDKYEERLP